MYSMVLMAALATSPVVPEHGGRGCHGCHGGCYGCYGGGCYGGCWGGRGHGCHGCSGGWGCHGGYYGCSGGYSCSGGAYYGCSGGYYGCTGGYGTVVAPADRPAPPPPPPAKKKDLEAPEAAARLIVDVPADARVFIDDRPTNSTSTVRTFVTPALNPQKSYVYTVRAEIMRDGAPVQETKEVTVSAGSTSRLSFTDLTRAAANDGKVVTTAAR